MRRVLLALAAAAATALAGASAGSAATWQPYQLPPPPGGQFSTPVGFVGDLSFWAPNRGLMTVAGNNSVKPGLYSWDGESWHQLSTVCGGGANAKIAWAGPTEFWTITQASVGSTSNGLGLCRYKDGAVVGSYSFYNVPDFGARVNAAACRNVNDCWFGGVGTVSADGSQAGAFHLHWDGTNLKPVYNGQGRGVSDLTMHRGALLESTYVGPGPFTPGARPFLARPESPPALLHQIDGLSFANDPFTFAPRGDTPVDGTELRSLDSDGTTAWAVGGGANSGPATADGTAVERPPVALRKDGDGAWRELPLSGELPELPNWFGMVAAVPGTRDAWTTVNSIEVPGISDEGGPSKPSVAHVAVDGTVSTETLDNRPSPASRGNATAIACPTANDCWVATAKGFLYRLTDGATYARDTDPAFQGTISSRPNEAAAQVIPDDPPADDSRLFAPPVILPDPSTDTGTPTCPTVKPLVSRVKATTGRLTVRQRRQANVRIVLTVRFRLARSAKVGLTARRGTKVVARVKSRTLKPGTRSLRVTVRRKSFPKRLKFSLAELTKPVCNTDNNDSIDTGGDR